MSHVARVELEIKDLQALRAACKQLGLTYDEKATSWKWWMTDYPNWVTEENQTEGIPRSRYGTSDAGVITVPGARWSIGVYKDPAKPGCYVPIYDAYEHGGDLRGRGLGIEDKLGAGLQKLKQEYGITISTKVMQAKGFQVFRNLVNVKGKQQVQLRCVK